MKLAFNAFANARNDPSVIFLNLIPGAWPEEWMVSLLDVGRL